VRVLIDTTYLRRAPYSGTAVYLTELIAALDWLADVDVVTAANPARRAWPTPPPTCAGPS
jgi:hypothetical protein